MSKDKQGRSYAKVSDIHAGSIIETDEGFDCLEYKKCEKVIHCDDQGLYFECGEGKHYLDGQIDGSDRDFYVGLYEKGK